MRASPSAIWDPHADPRSNPVLFKRIRDWLRKSEEARSLEPSLQEMVEPLLADFQAKRVLLLFGRVDQYTRDVRRSSSSINQEGIKVIELYIGGLRDTDDFVKMDEKELGYLAGDAIDLYTKHWGPKKLPRALATPAPS